MTAKVKKVLRDVQKGASVLEAVDKHYAHRNMYYREATKSEQEIIKLAKLQAADSTKAATYSVRIDNGLRVKLAQLALCNHKTPSDYLRHLIKKTILEASQSL